MAGIISTLIYFLSILTALILGGIATAWMLGMLEASIVYVRTYFSEGRQAAEEKALDRMGESKVSYGIKDTLKRNRLVNIKEVNDLQDTVGGLVGDQFGKGGLGEELGKGLGKGL